ncbi:Transcription initiation factor IIF alpha subunit [hydrothermal vent metagenome]|uniref:Transcription initiation factor IIF alpha subunit n=1 Tax=hydrothermal vent metagenome TaxID=652676 RepID=A0A1W1C2L9_9ZZZZ
MNILLINSNPVVSRLISLCMREEDTVFEEVESVNDVTLDRYAVVFVDDRSYNENTKRVLENLMIRKKVFLSSTEANEEISELFDEVIKKPFLPSQIRAVLKAMDERESVEKAMNVPSIFPLASEKKTEQEHVDDIVRVNDTNVLDSNEIEKIKALLEMEEEDEVPSVEALDEEEIEARKVEMIKQQLEADGLEIVSEEEYVEALSSKAPKKKKKNKSKKNKEETFNFEKALLSAVEGMKVKKIKKLLKGAEVTIKIDFKGKK